MVLESIISGLLNKYLSKYIKNLDGKNLELGIFNSSLELTDLQLKPEALAELNLPIEITAGHIGRIYVDFSWTGLFSEPVVVNVEDVLVLVSPLADRPYDEEKARDLANAFKQQKLSSLEKPKKSSSSDSDSGDHDMSFTEKLTAAIINNIQVNVSNVHIRYEDCSTYPGRPFAFGVALHRLSALTTDEEWEPAQMDATATIMRKLMEAIGFSAYWNTSVSDPVSRYVASGEWREILRSSILGHEVKGQPFDFVVEPVTTTARLTFDKSDQLDYSKPQVVLDILTSALSISFSRQQFLAAIDLQRSLQLMAVNERYRKYRPSVGVRGNARRWWHYAYTAILEEHIRPWSRRRIEAHLEIYNTYWQKYKQKLVLQEQKQDTTAVDRKLRALEDRLDLTNIIVGRERAKTEFIKEKPERDRARREKKKQESSWLSRLFGWDEDDDEDDEEDDQEVHIAVVVMLSTDAMRVEGAVPNKELVPLVSSEKLHPDTSMTSQVFSIDFETSPLTVPADLAIAITSEPIDIVYNQHAVSELIAFFKVPNLDIPGLKSAAYAGIQELAKVSQNSLLYAIEHHKTIQVDFDVKSPNIIIPEHGLLDLGGHLLILDLGSLRVNSELQKDTTALEDATPTEIEARLYDKFVIRINDIQVLLVEPGADWREALLARESKYHLLPSLGLQVNTFISAKPDYKELPQHKIEAVLPSLKLAISDSKIQALVKFAKNLPLPDMQTPSDNIPYRVNLPSVNLKEVKSEMSTTALRQAKRLMLRSRRTRVAGTSITSRRVTNVDEVDSKPVKPPTPPAPLKGDVYYTASDHSDEEIQQWAASSTVPKFDDNDSPTNKTSTLLRFVIREVVVSISKPSESVLPVLKTSGDRSTSPVPPSPTESGESEYLSLRIDSVCVDVAVSTYGLAVHMGLRGIQVIDKFHIGPDGTYLHLISSMATTELISILYRKVCIMLRLPHVPGSHGSPICLKRSAPWVDEKCPDFGGYYGSTEQAVVVHFTALNVMFHRTAILFLQKTLTDMITSLSSISLAEKVGMTPSSETPSKPPTQPQPSAATLPVPPKAPVRGVIRFHAEATMEYLCVTLTDVFESLGNVYIRGLQFAVIDKDTRMTLKARLQDFSFEDAVTDSVYPKIICLQDQTAIDVRIVQFKQPPRQPIPTIIPPDTGASTGPTHVPLDYSLKLRLGSIQVVLLGPYIKELVSFFEPFINQGAIETAKEASNMAVKTVDDIQQKGVKVGLDIKIRSPILLVPETPTSAHALVAHLGNLSIISSFDTEGGVESPDGRATVTAPLMMYITTRLTSVQISRAVIQANQTIGSYRLIVEPVELRVDLSRPVNPNVAAVNPLRVTANLEIVQVNIGEQDIITILSTLSENLMAPSRVVTETLPEETPVTTEAEVHSPHTASESPPVESAPPAHQPSSAPAARKTVYVQFVMEGAELELYTNEQRLQRNGKGVSSRDPRNGLSRFRLQQVNGLAVAYSNGAMKLRTTVQTVMLEDIRPNSPLAIRQLILKSSKKSRLRTTPSSPPSTKVTPMIEVTFTQDANQMQTIEFTIDGVRVNIFVHYLLAVYNFLSSALTQSKLESPLSPSVGQTSRQTSRTLSVQGPVGQSVSRSEGLNLEAPAPREPPRRSLQVIGRLRRPEVVLFDEPTSQNSQCLVFQTVGNFEYQSFETQQHIVANLSSMQLFSCVYSQALKTAYQVLEPCAVTFTRVTNAEQGDMMTADVTDICLHVSPRVAYVVRGVVEALTSVTQKPASNRQLLEDYEHEDMWTPKPIFSHGFHKRKGSMKNMVDFAPPPEPSTVPRQKIQVQVPRLEVHLELEENLDHVALLRLTCGFQGSVIDWSYNLRSEAELQLGVSSYNEKLSVWEPVLEPVMEKEGDYRLWELTARLTRAESHPIKCFSMGDRNPEGPRDSVDGGIQLVHSPGSYPVTETDSDSDTNSETELEWDGHYSSSFLSSDIASPQDEERHPPQESKSENEEEETEGGFFDRVEHVFRDIFTSDSEEEEEAAAGRTECDGGGGRMELPLGNRLNAGHSDSGISSSARNSYSAGSSEPRDDLDSDTEVTDVETMANYIIISSQDKLQLSVTPVSLGVVKDLTDAFSTVPQPQLQIMRNVQEAPTKIVNTTGLNARLLVPAAFIEMAEAAGLSLVPINGGMVAPSRAIPPLLLGEKSEAQGRDTPDGMGTEDCDEAEGLDDLEDVVKPSKYCRTKSHVSCMSSIETETDAQDINQNGVTLEVDGFRSLTNLIPALAGTSLYPLTPSSSQSDKTYGIVREVHISHGMEKVKLRSPLQVSNHCPVALQLFYKKLDLQTLHGAIIPGLDEEEFTSLGVVQPNDVMDIPVIVAYHAGIYACPVDQGYGVSEKPILWRDLQEPAEMSYLCPPNKKGALPPFYIKVKRKEQKIPRPQGLEDAPCFTLDIYPPVTLHNYLPYDLVYTLEETGLKFLLQGDKMAIYSTDLSEPQSMKIQVKQYLSANWEGHLPVSREMKTTESIVMATKQVHSDQRKYLTLWAHSSSEGGSWDIFLYSPYWFVNKSELPVEIRASRSRKIFSTHSLRDPVLFTFSNSKRKKAKLRVFDSVWSASFSLDTVGSSGVVTCKDEDHDRTYQFWLDIRMSHLPFTKLVTLTPYFLIHNKTDQDLSYTEDGVKAGVWVQIKPSEVLPFWPGSESMKLILRRSTTPDNLSSRPFLIDTPNTTVLRMERGTGITVQVEGGVQEPTTVTFLPYASGHAPVRLDNLCDTVNLRFNQKNHGGRLLLMPHQTLLYTWDDPTAERCLMWNLYNRNKKSFDCILDQDGWGKVTVSCESAHRSTLPGDGLYVEGDDASVYSTDDEEVTETDGILEHPLMNKKQRTTIYWVSFMEGLQRVLLFTQSSRIARAATQANVSEPASLEFIASLQGIYVSLVNAAYEEVAYVSLFSSPARWEVESKANRWKALSMELTGVLENAWKHGEDVIMDENGTVQADLTAQTIVKPVQGALRRIHNPGLWLHYRQSDHHQGVHLKIQKIQIDNQLFDAYFANVLHVNALPKDVLKKTGPRPFIEMSILRRHMPEYGTDTIKYFKVLVQEASVNIDNGFVMSVLDVFSDMWKQEDEVVSLQADLDYIQSSLKETSNTISSSTANPVFFEYFHLSPLKLIVSLSLSGVPHIASEKPASFQQDIGRLLVESIGSTFTEVTEVELKLAYFERKNALLTTAQLISEVQAHYISQGIKQAYVFILGLDVLGNPYGLYRDVKEGISDFFYEPYLGLIQGPGEFAEGLAKGVQSLLGHTIGGVADAFGSFSGTLGKALAVLSFDQAYQKSRERRMSRHQDSFPLHLLSAGQGFVMGIVLGLSGVITSPILGAQEEGVKGFFKGIGKGLLGLVTKPLGGTVDAITLVLEGIERAADAGENIVGRLRIPRFINPKEGLTPYSPYKSVGNCILHNIRKREIYNTDIYYAHVTVSSDSTPDVVMVTTRRVLVLEKCRWSGGWDLEQGDLFINILTSPQQAENKVLFTSVIDGKQLQRELVCENGELAK
ncbi:intermembrane lipid transfer protein VPS13A-like, partial [Diadema antillarum]|uniref:intermembrane lipid transfer protein VPS13A-like n=1 Tax=Diadema antillarum TaxID=105358 RepID=UPI003A8647DD